MNRQGITRIFHIDAGHRLMRHESKCRNIHGHRYTFHVTVSLAEHIGGLDGNGRVVDFSVIKEEVGDWLNAHWDHGFIAEDKDEEMIAFCTKQGSKCCILPFSPSIENLTRALYEKVTELLAPDLECARVIGYETESCYAEYTRLDARIRELHEGGM